VANIINCGTCEEEFDLSRYKDGARYKGEHSYDKHLRSCQKAFDREQEEAKQDEAQTVREDRFIDDLGHYFDEDTKAALLSAIKNYFEDE
jgi:hypothetical protein